MATGDEHIEKPTGDINGTNAIFYTLSSYQSNTLYHLINGTVVDPSDDDGITEINPATGEFHLKVTPRGGVKPDTLHVRYLEA